MGPVPTIPTYEYDLRGNKIYEGGATYPVRYAYDVYGNRTSMTTYRDEPLSQGVEGRARTPAAPQAGDTTSWVYDEASGLVTGKRYADGTSVCYTYSDDGKLTSRTWARGVVTTYAYDGWGNLVSTTYSDGTPSVTLSYDALGRLVTANDVTGTTTYSYDEYGDEAQVATSGLYSKTLVRHRDAYGRDLGHTMDGSRKNIIEYEPTTGRIKRTMLGGAWFTWDYLQGSDLKSRLTYGGSGNTEWTYEPKRDLLTRVKNTIYGSVVSQYDYTNDAIGRRTEIARSGTKMTETRSDAYGYNARSELTNAVKNATLNEYAYRYDDIGNRETSFERGMSATYAANCLNQYTDIEYSAVQPSTSNLQPLYDADGNQTLVKTKTGIWSVTYNGENRPVLWTCGATNIVMKFDRMGRRVEYIECDGAVTNKHQKFVYDGYLCIQRLNGSNNSITELFEWDPTEPVATRPMFMQYRVPGQTYALFYTHDGNKNVSEVVHFSRANGVAAHYEYAPFGETTAQVRQGGITAYDFAALNPWRFSSEYADDASATVYYNYRHYEPVMGRWLQRDHIEEYTDINTFSTCKNSLINRFDYLGALGITVSHNSYQMQKFRVVAETVVCWEKCGKCYLPCDWERKNEQIVDLPINIMTTIYTGGLSHYEIAHGIAEEIYEYGKDKARDYLIDKLLDKFGKFESAPGLPFEDEFDAIKDSKYKDYLLPGTYRVPGYEGYIFTGSSRSITGWRYYPPNHLIVPDCKNRHKTSMYYIPIGLSYWTDEQPW